jgi:putative sigma-54 modulation protein
MNVRFTARHFEASNQLKEFSKDAVSKLENFYDRIVSCSIVLEPDPSDETPQKAELIVKIPNTTLTASESAEKYETAILAVVDNLSRQLKRYKEKKFQPY